MVRFSDLAYIFNYVFPPTLEAFSVLKSFSLRLCRAPSGRFKGVPFVPVLACAVDLFPHTNHCEAIMVFERADPALWRVQYGHLSAPEKQSASIEKESSDNQETEAPAEAEDSTNVDEEVAQQNETGDDGAAE